MHKFGCDSKWCLRWSLAKGNLSNGAKSPNKKASNDDGFVPLKYFVSPSFADNAFNVWNKDEINAFILFTYIDCVFHQFSWLLLYCFKSACCFIASAVQKEQVMREAEYTCVSCSCQCVVIEIVHPKQMLLKMTEFKIGKASMKRLFSVCYYQISKPSTTKHKLTNAGTNFSLIKAK